MEVTYTESARVIEESRMLLREKKIGLAGICNPDERFLVILESCRKKYEQFLYGLFFGAEIHQEDKAQIDALCKGVQQAVQNIYKAGERAQNKGIKTEYIGDWSPENIEKLFWEMSSQYQDNVAWFIDHSSKSSRVKVIEDAGKILRYHHPSTLQKLAEKYKTFEDTPWILKVVATNQLIDPETALHDIKETIRSLKRDPRLAFFANNQSFITQAAVYHVEKAEEVLLRAQAIAENLISDPELD